MEKISITNLDRKSKIKLGSWCNKKELNEIEYHWSNRKKLKRDYLYLKKLRKKTLRYLVNKLNKLNSLNYSMRSWTIIIDPCLTYILSSLFDRWEIIKSLDKKYKYDFYNYKESSFILKNPSDIEKNFSESDEFNQFVFQKVINKQKKKNLYISKKIEKKLKKEKIKNKIKKKNKLKYIFLKRIFNKNEILIIDSYFPNSLQLQFRNTRFIEFKDFFINYEFSFNNRKDEYLRKNLFKSFKADNDFENFIKEEIGYFLPNYFLENFKDYQKQLDELNLDFKHIFSSGLHHVNVLLKFYIAKSIESNKGFFIIEHGGSLPAIDYYLGYEVDVSNKLISWHKKINDNYFQLPAQKLLKKKIVKNINANKHYILLNRIKRYTFRAEFSPLTGLNSYIKNFCKIFYDNLDSKISDKTYLKMHPSDNDKVWKNFNFYKKISKSKVDKDEGLSKVFENTKLITCLYPETSFAECIANNTPSILLYPKKFYERHKKFSYVIDKMEAAKIIFFDPQKAALHINDIWKEVDNWWTENKTQSAIKLFKKDLLGLEEPCKDEKKWFNFIECKYRDFLD